MLRLFEPIILTVTKKYLVIPWVWSVSLKNHDARYHTDRMEQVIRHPQHAQQLMSIQQPTSNIHRGGVR